MIAGFWKVNASWYVEMTLVNPKDLRTRSPIPRFYWCEWHSLSPTSSRTVLSRTSSSIDACVGPFGAWMRSARHKFPSPTAIHSHVWLLSMSHLPSRAAYPRLTTCTFNRWVGIICIHFPIMQLHLEVWRFEEGWRIGIITLQHHRSKQQQEPSEAKFFCNEAHLVHPSLNDSCYVSYICNEGLKWQQQGRHYWPHGHAWQPKKIQSK
jgi:hypothetical protein